MAKRNSYALKSREGNKIFHSWEECQAAIKTHTGVSYKAFANDDMCRDWFAGKCPAVFPITNEPGRVIIYTDGSFNATVHMYGWGFVAILSNDSEECRCHSEYGGGTNSALLSQRNVAGEMIAAMKAVQWAVLHGYKTVELRYDYAGIGKWPLDIQQISPGNEYAKTYRDWMKRMADTIDIRYVQIPGHSGDWYNEYADQRAKKGCNS